MTARSTASGDVLDRREPVGPRARRRGADRVDGPGWPARRFARAAPTEPGRAVAPIRAMLRGASTCRTAATAVRRSRSSKGAGRLRGDRASHGELVRLGPDATGKPLVAEDVDHPWLSGRTTASKVSSPRSRPRRRGARAAASRAPGRAIRPRPPRRPRPRRRWWARTWRAPRWPAGPPRRRRARTPRRRPVPPHRAPRGACRGRRRRTGRRGTRPRDPRGRRRARPRLPAQRPHTDGVAVAQDDVDRPHGAGRTHRGNPVGSDASPRRTGPTVARSTVVSRRPVPRTTGGRSVRCR